MSEFTRAFFQNLPSKNANAIVTGYCAGVLADGHLDESEVAGLRTLIAHCGVSDAVGTALEVLLLDWQAGNSSLSELGEQLRRIAGGELAQGEALHACTLFCADPVPDINLSGAFAFTGVFMGRTRQRCHALCELMGGKAKTSVTGDIDYLIVGTGAPPAYSHGTWGGKIEKAIKLQADGQCAIVSEADWLEQIKRAA